MKCWMMALCVGGLTAPGLAGPTFNSHNLSGQTDWNATSNATSVEQSGFGSNSSGQTPTTVNGQTGGGLLNVCDLEAGGVATIADSFIPGDVTITYDFHSEATFDIVNYTGLIQCNIGFWFLFTVTEQMNYSVQQSGDFSGPLAFGREDGVPLGAVLVPGVQYRVNHNFASSIGTTGDVPIASDIDDATWTLTLQPVPAPSAVAMAGLGAMVLGLKRRRS